jgi:cytochrome P450 PksS
MPPEIATLDITSPRFKANPYPLYKRLRNETPVCPTRLPDGRVAWLVARYDDAAVVLKDPRFAKDRRRVPEQRRSPLERIIGPLVRTLQYNMLFLDPPDHTRLRNLVHKAFTPRLIERMRERMQVLADELLDDAAHTREWDLVDGYALPIPATVIADLLGVPDTDRDLFHRWSSKMVSITSGGQLLMALPAALSFMSYLKRLFALRRLDPSDDLTTALVQAEEEGDHLSADELLSMVFLLLVAGHETTVNLIASGTLALLEQPDQLARLRHQPELLESGAAVEELLRFTSPVQVATERYALQDVELSGTTIPSGALVLAMVGSANRDERQFADPDRLDLGRTPNPHLAFGQGAHYCLGAPLARLEGQIAFSTLIRRMPDFHLAVAPESLPWRRSLFLRGIDHLPIAVSGVARAAA